MHENLPWSVPAYFFLFLIAMSCMLPAGPFAVGLGFTYGVATGLAIHLSACLFAANIIFFLGSTFRDTVEARVRRFPKVSALRHVVKDTSSAFKIIFVSCQTPIPFGLHVGFFSVSGVSAVTFFQSFTLGIIPLSVLSLYIGEAANMSNSSVDDTSSSGLEAVVFWVGLIASAGFVAYIAWQGKNVLENLESTGTGEVDLLVVDKAPPRMAPTPAV